MLPKITYRKLLKRLDQIKANWSKDAETAAIPYCIKSSLHTAIDHLITQDRVRIIGSGARGREAFIDQVIAGLIIKNLVSTPLTGSGVLYPVGSAEQLSGKFKLSYSQFAAPQPRSLACLRKNDS